MARNRRNPKAIVFIVITLLVALIAGGLFYNALGAKKRELTAASAKAETVQVVMARKDLTQGSTIKATHVILAEMPPDFIPETVFYNLNEVIGRVPQERILANELVREERLADPEAGVGLNAIIPRGMRAVSIEISDGSGVSGFLNPGNYADVLITVENEDGVKTTKTLLQAIFLLAVDNRMGGDDQAKKTNKPTVTMALTAEQAQMMTHAMRVGDVTLTLRNDVDVTHVATHGAISNHLIGIKDTKLVKAEEIIAVTSGKPPEPVIDEPEPEPEPEAKVSVPKNSNLNIIRGAKTEVKSVNSKGRVRTGK